MKYVIAGLAIAILGVVFKPPAWRLRLRVPPYKRALKPGAKLPATRHQDSAETAQSTD